MLSAIVKPLMGEIYTVIMKIGEFSFINFNTRGINYYVQKCNELTDNKHSSKEDSNSSDTGGKDLNDNEMKLRTSLLLLPHLSVKPPTSKTTPKVSSQYSSEEETHSDNSASTSFSLNNSCDSIIVSTLTNNDNNNYIGSIDSCTNNSTILNPKMW